jgi:phosphopantothenoylcysteine decarboxylase/phosphopantothenate--cysteine ligase
MRILITAGGTREYIDPVRFISNASSGRMGYALVRAALRAGHKVTLITAPTGQRPPNGATLIEVETAAGMFEEVRNSFKMYDCLIMAAAVSDYTPVRTAKTKMKKSDKSLILRLKPTTDILKWAGKNKRKNQIVVGFALEDKAIQHRAEKKLKEKNLDMIIANTTKAIGSEESAVQIKTPGCKWLKFPKSTKIKLAGQIIREIENISG